MQIVIITLLIQSGPVIKYGYLFPPYEVHDSLKLIVWRGNLVMSSIMEFEPWPSVKMSKEWHGHMGFTRLSEMDFFKVAGFQNGVTRIKRHQCITKLIGASSVVSIVGGFVLWWIGARESFENKGKFGALGWSTVTLGTLLCTWAFVRVEQTVNPVYLAVEAADHYNSQLPEPSKIRKNRRWSK